MADDIEDSVFQGSEEREPPSVNWPFTLRRRDILERIRIVLNDGNLAQIHLRLALEDATDEIVTLRGQIASLETMLEREMELRESLARALENKP